MESTPQPPPNKKDQPAEAGQEMGLRGITRPMAEKEMRQHHQQHHTSSGSGTEEKDQPAHQMAMTPEMRQHMLQLHYQHTLWVYWLVILLGSWILLSPFTFDYGIGAVSPAGGRQVWLSLPQRIVAMEWSDIISGSLLLLFGWRCLKPDRPISRWICCFVGVWLTFAPLVFWSPSAAAYLNDTLVGALIIALTILVPGMPNMIMYMKMGPDTPPGWSYNPSSWPQRWIMIFTGFLGWVVSRYLAAFQLGYINEVWDPFFGGASMQVLNSSMSHSLPISDAGLGAMAYTFEFLMGWMGSPARWRTMPWMVAFFGILVIPLGFVHIFLVISQPVLVGAWCTFCILAAAIMLPMIPLEVDEVIAMGQFIKIKRRQGEKFWSLFWKGGTVESEEARNEAPELITFPDQPAKVFWASVWGMSFPWTLTLATVLGIGLMGAPALFNVGIQESVADVFHLSGALIVVVSVVSMGEPLRLGRYLNVPLALAVALVPWFLSNVPTVLSIIGLVAGIGIILLSVPRGPKTQQYAGWDDYIR